MYTNSTRHTDCIPSCTINLPTQKLSDMLEITFRKYSIHNSAAQNWIQTEVYIYLIPIPTPYPELCTPYPVPGSEIVNVPQFSLPVEVFFGVVTREGNVAWNGTQQLDDVRYVVYRGKYDITFYTFCREKFVFVSQTVKLYLYTVCPGCTYACIITNIWPYLLGTKT